jgi:hypothetical protein
MAEYKIKEENKKAILNKRLWKILPLFIIAIIVVYGISFYQMNITKLFITILLPVTILMGIALFIGAKAGLKIYKENHLDILFKIDNNIFTVIKNGKDDITVGKENIMKIEQYKDKSIIIFLNDKNKILLDDNIENHDDLIDELNNICPIISAEPKKSNTIYIFSALIMMALMAIFYISTNKFITIIVGIVISISLIFSFIKIFFNKQTDKKIKLCILIIFIIIYEIIMKIFNII